MLRTTMPTQDLKRYKREFFWYAFSEDGVQAWMKMSKSTLVKGLIGEDAFKADSITWGDKINISTQAWRVLCISSMDYDYSWNGVFDH